jgi:putative hemolysin
LLVEAPVFDDLRNQLYNISIAQNSDEVEAALRLRFNVFARELDRNFTSGNEIDKDEYDDQCHHLIVKENKTGNVIGTYRLQSKEQADSGKGFYTAKRFKIEELPEEVLAEAVEVGRACIHEDHRNGRVLFLLWKGLAAYLEHFNKRYLFGYSALQTSNKQIAHNTYAYLGENDFLHPEFDISVRDQYKCIPGNGVENTDEIDIPPLFKNYLDVGTKICSQPAYDKDLNLIHFVILLDVEAISERTRKMFFG